ncbi:hypothetical protein HCA33_03005 [Listeria seeligeri]|nr:hypothetical protein [Listeria seeligeri]MBC1541486.1 hypothetical protein [Listeria seeligeri]MBC1866213.1 hypothetical protein [Listeria seeligeri]MBC1878977.1 hypothetical protein [Listeria seeligeri]MBC2209153.1 hypothetical protein [Listeria seeligeri]
MKIRIIGSVGSGKTTLAKKLSEMEGIPYFETDRIVWKREQTEVRRTDSEKREQPQKWLTIKKKSETEKFLQTISSRDIL